MLLPLGSPFKYHEEILYLPPMIPPKHFDIFPPGWGDAQKVYMRSSKPDWGMLRMSKYVQIFFKLYTFIYFHLNYSRWASFHLACCCCGHKDLSIFSPRLTPYDFFYLDARSALFLQLFNQWQDHTYSSSCPHDFR